MTLSLFEPAQPCEHGASRAVEGAGEIRDGRMWLDAQPPDQSTVQRVKTGGAIVQGGHLRYARESEIDHVAQHLTHHSLNMTVTLDLG